MLGRGAEFPVGLRGGLRALADALQQRAQREEFGLQRGSRRRRSAGYERVILPNLPIGFLSLSLRCTSESRGSIITPFSSVNVALSSSSRFQTPRFAHHHRLGISSANSISATLFQDESFGSTPPM